MFCTDTADQSAYQDLIDLDDAKSERLAEIHSELFDAFNGAFDKPDAQVPCVEYGFRADTRREVTMPVNEAISNCFMEDACVTYLRALIKDPTPVNAAKLRLLMATVYAEEFYEKVAEVRE